MKRRIVIVGLLGLFMAVSVAQAGSHNATLPVCVTPAAVSMRNTDLGGLRDGHPGSECGEFAGHGHQPEQRARQPGIAGENACEGQNFKLRITLPTASDSTGKFATGVYLLATQA